MNKFFKFVEANKDVYLEELLDFIRQKSISTTGEGIRECVQMLKGYMEKAGITTEVYETAMHPVVYGEVIRDKSLPTILVYGHYDVQPPDPIELWDNDPFDPVIKDGKIYARGSSDDKGQLFAHIKATEAYLKIYGELPVNMKFIFEGEEEIGSVNLNTFVSTHKELLKCDVAIFSDSHIHESGKPTIILGLKGLLYVELNVKGANRDLHSKFAAAIKNPTWRLVYLLDTLKDDKGFIKIDGFYDKVRKTNKLEDEAVNKIPYNEKEMLEGYGIKKFEENRTGHNYFYNMMFEPTCNIDGFLSGYTGEGSKTVLPNKAMVKIDFRLVPNQEPEDILRLLKAHLDKYGFNDIEVKELGMMSASRTAIDDKYVEITSEAIKEGWGEYPIIYPTIGGSGPNSVFVDNLNVRCIVVPFAGADQNNHGINENMIIHGYYNGIKTAGAIMKKVSEMGVEK